MNTLVAYAKRLEYAQESIVVGHKGLVKRIAHHLMMKLPASVQFDDLYQSGMLGLLEAARNYDETKGASFETYASIRIRGHMLDEVRRSGWMPRSVYKNSRIIAEAVKTVENRLGREATDSEVAQELHIDLDEYFTLVQDAAVSPLYGFDDLGVTDNDIEDLHHGDLEPQDKVVHEDFIGYLNQLIDTLPKNERLVLLLHYERDLNLKEIGDILCVSESRVSQIHAQATLRVRGKLNEKV